MYDSRPDTLEHIGHVRRLLRLCVNDLMDRAERHDQSKLMPPEKELFDRVTQRLRDQTYGSQEYKDAVAQMLKEGLAHHYQHKSGSILCSIDLDQLRFSYSNTMRRVFINTVKVLNFDEY